MVASKWITGLLREAATRYIAIAFVLVLLPASAIAIDCAPDELIVRMKPVKGMTTASAIKVVQASVGGAIKREIKDLGYVTIKLPKGADLEQAIGKLKNNPVVDYVGPNHRIYAVSNPPQYFPNDPVFQYGADVFSLVYFDIINMPCWGLYNDGYGAYRADVWAPEAWHIYQNTPNKAQVVIAVIDTGVDYYHQDLRYKIWQNPGEIPYNGIDDDNNGFIDDTMGWNFVSNNNDPLDDMIIYHGTMVASVAAAKGDDGVGMAGMAWDSPILPVKVIGEDGSGLEDDAAAGIVYAVNLGAKVINLSLSGDNAPSLKTAVDYAWENGAICVCASGNEAKSTPSYPASYEHSLAVGGTDPYDNWWYDGPKSGSNYGPYIDVVAPSVDVVGASNLWMDIGLGDEPYDAQAGTSLAAPFVSGLAAMIWSIHPDWPNTKVFYQILHTADDIHTPGYDIYTGWGRINAYRALTEPFNELTKIADVKKLPLGSAAAISGRVLTTRSPSNTDPKGDFQNKLYVEDPDRASGILLSFANGAPNDLVPGDIVDIIGATGIVNGELAIVDPFVAKTGFRPALKPLGVTNKAMGGGQFGQQAAVINRFAYPRTMATGANNIGLLVKVWGRVKAVGSNFFYIDDGSGTMDDTDNMGVRVVFDPDKIQRPAGGQYAWVTGISSCEYVGGSTTLSRRVLRPRTQSDIGAK